MSRSPKPATIVRAQQTLTRMPQFQFYGSQRAQLVAVARYHTPIKGYVCAAPHVVLGSDGHLFISPGYIWDFGSGPAVDTPDMIYASLAHDAFYDLMQRDQLPWKERKAVDKYFRQLLKDAGMGPIRRTWVYYGVRWGFPLAKPFLKKHNV